MKTYKTIQTKTGLDIQLSQTFTMNAAQDIKILICIYSMVESAFKQYYLKSKNWPNINSFAFYKKTVLRNNKIIFIGQKLMAC